MKTKAIALLALACVCVFSTVVCAGGPIRNFIREHRPGILIPKRGGGCSNCPGCNPAPAPGPITDPGLEVGPTPNGTYTLIQVGGSYTIRPTFAAPSCSGGNCGTGGTYYTLPSCPNGRCPVR